MKVYKVIGFESVDGSEDSFYLHENDESLQQYLNDPDWRSIGVVGTTDETVEEFTGL